MREAAQNEMLLDEGSTPATVLDELQHLLAQLKGYEEEVARINKYQQLFKVCSIGCSITMQLLVIIPQWGGAHTGHERCASSGEQVKVIRSDTFTVCMCSFRYCLARWVCCACA